jgi:ABC-type multidrug transport system fused ATPase/permease subunit
MRLPVVNLPNEFAYIGGTGYIGPLPIATIIVAVIFAVLYVLLTRSRFGYYVYAIGGDESATRLAGVNVRRVRTLVYVISGTLAAIAAVLLSSRVNSGQPSLGAWRGGRVAVSRGRHHRRGPASRRAGEPRGRDARGDLARGALERVEPDQFVVLRATRSDRPDRHGGLRRLGDARAAARGLRMTTGQEDAQAMVSSETARPLLELRGITKHYGHIRAIEAVDFELYAGEVLALVGDNGAGKSTLIKIISGAVTPDRGEILLDGRPAHLRSPQDAAALGITTVYQHLALIDTRDVLANMFLGHEPSR